MARPDDGVVRESEEHRPDRREQGIEISARQVRVVVLKYTIDWSFAEIASRDGIPIGTAKCYAHRARSSLRERLAR